MELKEEVNCAAPGAAIYCAATLLTLKSYRFIPSFMRLSMQIVSQLKQSDGLIRYAIKTDIPRKTFRTFSVWMSFEQMRDFVGSDPHRAAVARISDWRDTDGIATVEWAEQPDKTLDWREIDDHLKDPTELYTRRD